MRNGGDRKGRHICKNYIKWEGKREKKMDTIEKKNEHSRSGMKKAKRTISKKEIRSRGRRSGGQEEALKFIRDY